MSEREIHDKLDPKVWTHGAPVTRDSIDGHEATVVQTWGCHTRFGDIVLTKIPFYTDFASFPERLKRWLPRLFPARGKWDYAAIIHDWIYWSGCKSKKAADRIFYELMLNLKVSKARAWVMYKAVDWWGQSTWDEYRSKENKQLRKEIDVVQGASRASVDSATERANRE